MEGDTENFLKYQIQTALLPPYQYQPKEKQGCVPSALPLHCLLYQLWMYVTPKTPAFCRYLGDTLLEAQSIIYLVSITNSFWHMTLYSGAAAQDYVSADEEICAIEEVIALEHFEGYLQIITKSELLNYIWA